MIDWSKRVTKAELDRRADPDVIDAEALNAALAQQGSVFRALAELQFEEANRVRGWLAKPLITKAQFIAALKSKMRG